MIKITIEDQYGQSMIESVKDDLDIYEMMELIERALLATSYHYNSIKDGFISKAEEYEDKR